ncbi:MAG: hypothetical protein XE02_0628, partial [Mesotoga infera]
IKTDKTIVPLVSQKYNTELASLSPIKPETQSKSWQYHKGMAGCSLRRQPARLTGLTVNQMVRA